MVRFGILGPGGIANKFADACRQSDSAVVAAVASRNLERAGKFALAHGIEKAYGSYDELLADEAVDAVYISVINTAHRELVCRSLEAGKAVLCEKPMGMSYEETEKICGLARQKGLLLMEATWTHFLPCIKKVHEWVDSGRIGKIRLIEDRFAFSHAVDPENRLFNAEVGGGAALDLGPYSISFLLAFARSGIETIQASTICGQTGVDETDIVVLKFSNGVIGSGISSIRDKAGDDAWLYGENGRIYLEHFWKCTRAELQDADGKVLESVTDATENGFVFEVEAFCKAFAENAPEVPEVSHMLSLQCAEVIEKIRRC